MAGARWVPAAPKHPGQGQQVIQRHKPSPALASSAAVSSGWVKATEQLQGAGNREQGPGAGAVFGGTLHLQSPSLRMTPWPECLVGAPRLPVLGSMLSSSGSGRFGNADSVALRLGPSSTGFLRSLVE